MKTKNLIKFNRRGGFRLILLMTLFLTLQNVRGADVAINSTNFPDPNFRSYLISQFGDVLTQSEINNTTTMNLPPNKQISSLVGIKYFTELETLQCTDNSLTTLDLSSNTKLTGVQCDNNQLTALKVPNTLEWLGCSNNQLTSCCLSGTTHSYLKQLFVSNNPMTTLGTSFTNLPALEYFECSGTKFSKLDVSSCKNLKELTCEDMTSLTELTCTGTALTKLSVSGCSNLQKLYCNDNKLSYLDVYGCSSLLTLICSANALTTIYYLSSCNSSLEYLDCKSNKLTSLSFSGFDKLKYLYCSNNQLTRLTGLSGRWQLYKVDCSNNQLTSLDVTECYYLYSLNCSYNQLSSFAVSQNYIFGELQYLDCSHNAPLTGLNLSVDLFPKLMEVNCSYCDFRNISWDDLKLTTLDCSYNQNLTFLSNVREDDYDVRPLTTLNVDGCISLEQIIVCNNALTALDLRSCGNLSFLNCDFNQLTSLDLSNNSNIGALNCAYNNITSLDVRGFTSLYNLDCSGCQLTSLDLRGCNALVNLYCSENQLTSLILPQENKVLDVVYCHDNKIEGVMMDVLVASMPDRKDKASGYFYVLGYNEQNVLTNQNVNDAISNNWEVYAIVDYNWELYTGSSIPTTIRTADADVDDNAPRYNMSGQRVGRDYKGVVIKNGKKWLNNH